VFARYKLENTSCRGAGESLINLRRVYSSSFALMQANNNLTLYEYESWRINFVKYRSDIDGLRCFAVISVILYHLNQNVLPGGFTGVDIFFVISGFLITGIIVDGASRKQFTMSRFYARRVRRIFPALFVVLLVSTLFAVVTFEPDAYQRFFTELRYAILQISNFLFSQELGYFDASTETSPLLHTWSLGVEEQFYLVWPMLILTIFRFGRKKLGLILSLISVVSFIYSEYLVSSSPQIAFYMLHSRAWELGLGGILAIGTIPEIKSRLINNCFSVVGLVFLLIAFFAINDSSPFPGRNALLPVFGTVLLIYTGRSRNTFVSKSLSWKPFVIIGMLSYSLYLWHWPVIVFYKTITANEITVTSGVLLFLVTLFLSTLSYTFVEKPCRYGKFPKFLLATYQKESVQKSIFTTACYYLFPIMAIAALLTLLFLPSTFDEKNLHATTMVIDVRLKLSKRAANFEKLSVYWAYNGYEYSEPNSSSLHYSPERLVKDNLYQFKFNLPDIDQIDSIRIDPLLDVGIVEIVGVSFAGGIFKRSYDIDSETLKDTIAADVAWKVTTAFTQDSLVVESLGKDPFLILFKKQPVKFHDREILFVLFLLILLLVKVLFQSIRKGRENRAALLIGVVSILFVLLFSIRLQSSNYSRWRFLDDVNRFWLFDTAMTDIAGFPEPENPDVLLLGDSHVQHYALPVQTWSEKRNYSLKLLAQPACPPLFFEDSTILSKQHTSCLSRFKEVLNNTLNSSKTKYVFLALRQGFYLENPSLLLNRAEFKEITKSTSAEDIFINTFSSTISALEDAGKKVVILGQIPVLEETPKACLSRDVTLFSMIYRKTGTCDIDSNFSNKKLEKGKNLFQQLSDNSENVYYFEPDKYITSMYGENERVIYYGDNHLNKYGSILLDRVLKNELIDW